MTKANDEKMVGNMIDKFCSDMKEIRKEKEVLLSLGIMSGKGVTQSDGFLKLLKLDNDKG